MVDAPDEHGNKRVAGAELLVNGMHFLYLRLGALLLAHFPVTIRRQREGPIVIKKIAGKQVEYNQLFTEQGMHQKHAS